MSLGSPEISNVALAGIYGDDKGDTAPTTWHAHLFEGDPTGAGVECTGTDYAAVAIANTSANFPTPSGGQITPVTIDFGTAGDDDWGAPDFWALTDGSGNLGETQEISNPAAIDSGDPVVLTVTLGAT